MNRHELTSKMLAPAMAVALLGAAACSQDNETLRPSVETTTTAPNDDCVDPKLSAEAVAKANADLGIAYPGFGEDEIVTGCEKVDFAANPREASADASFAPEAGAVIESQTEISQWLASDDERAVKARGNVIGAFVEKGLPQSEIDRALSGECYIPVQANVPTVIEGTTYFVAGEIRSADARMTGAKDIMWLCFATDGQLIKGASLRADCFNPDFDVIRPLKPGEEVPNIDKVPVPTDFQSVPNAPGSGGSPEEGMDPENDSDVDGYGPGDSRPTVEVTPDPTTTIPERAEDGSTVVTGPEGTGPVVTLDPGPGTPDRDEVPSEPTD